MLKNYGNIKLEYCHGQTKGGRVSKQSYLENVFGPYTIIALKVLEDGTLYSLNAWQHGACAGGTYSYH